MLIGFEVTLILVGWGIQRKIECEEKRLFLVTIFKTRHSTRAKSVKWTLQESHLQDVLQRHSRPGVYITAVSVIFSGQTKPQSQHLKFDPPWNAVENVVVLYTCLVWTVGLVRSGWCFTFPGLLSTSFTHLYIHLDIFTRKLSHVSRCLIMEEPAGAPSFTLGSSCSAV